jgi:hypothetical protein
VPWQAHISRFSSHPKTCTQHRSPTQSAAMRFLKCVQLWHDRCWNAPSALECGTVALSSGPGQCSLCHCLRPSGLNQNQGLHLLLSQVRQTYREKISRWDSFPSRVIWDGGGRKVRPQISYQRIVLTLQSPLANFGANNLVLVNGIVARTDWRSLSNLVLDYVIQRTQIC